MESSSVLFLFLRPLRPLVGSSGRPDFAFMTSSGVGSLRLYILDSIFCLSCGGKASNDFDKHGKPVEVQAAHDHEEDTTHYLKRLKLCILWLVAQSCEYNVYHLREQVDPREEPEQETASENDHTCGLVPS